MRNLSQVDIFKVNNFFALFFICSMNLKLKGVGWLACIMCHSSNSSKSSSRSILVDKKKRRLQMRIYPKKHFKTICELPNNESESKSEKMLRESQREKKKESFISENNTLEPWKERWYHNITTRQSLHGYGQEEKKILYNA